MIDMAIKSSNGFIDKVMRYILNTWERTQLVICFVLVVLIAMSPLVIRSPYYIGIIILATLYAYIGITWNIVAGFTGQLLIAHIIFIAFGAYTTIVLQNKFGISPWIGLLASGVVAALLGVIVAFITLRYGLKMDYFGLFTIALMTALRSLFLKWDFVGGGIGMWVSLANTSFANMIFQHKEPYLYIALFLVVLGLFIQYRIYNSKMGRYFVAIREDEDAASALGVNTALYKTIAVVISATMAGIGGGFYVMYVTFIDPNQLFNLGLNVEMVMAAPIIGGLGSIAGPLLGALLNKPLAELIRGFLTVGTSGTSLIVYGTFLIVTILFLPRGIAGLLQNQYNKLRIRVYGEEKG